jgi:hypothetical protein
MLLDQREEFVVFEVAGEVIEAAGKSIPQRIVDSVSAILLYIVLDPLAKILV